MKTYKYADEKYLGAFFFFINSNSEIPFRPDVALRRDLNINRQGARQRLHFGRHFPTRGDGSSGREKWPRFIEILPRQNDFSRAESTDFFFPSTRQEEKPGT